MDGEWRRARWRWRLTAMVVVVVAFARTQNCVRGYNRAHLINNGYEDVVVGVSHAVEEKDGPALLEALKAVLSETSARLYRASYKRAYFRTVTLLVPRSWSSAFVTHKPGSESFEDSDIKVDEMNSVYRHQPHTPQPGGCGDPGQYIHLTPTYLMDDSVAVMYGHRGKVILQEWAKYRWGVFDELGYPNDLMYPLFYRDSKGRFTPSVCTNRRVRGKIIDVQFGDGCISSSPPHEYCRFIPDDHDQAMNSSLMSYLAIKSDKITQFCGGAEDAWHNPHAPTKHNFFCDGQSVWDVIQQHQDFKDGANPPTNIYQEPEFRITQQADANYALVLDYSGSMNDFSRVLKLRKTARRWLLHGVATGSYVAIINFSKKAELIHPLTKITDDNSRRILANAVRTKADGGTSIGSGLDLAANWVLKDTSNPTIVLLTDGEENENPRIDKVLNDVIASGTRVVTVAFGARADPGLEKIADVTGGKTFTATDVDEGQMLKDAFQGALTFQPPPPPQDEMITIYESEQQFDGQEASETFAVDFTLGRNLTLWLEISTPTSTSSPSLTNPQVTSPPSFISPSGEVFTDATFDAASSMWQLVVPEAQTGMWKWKVGLSGEQKSLVRGWVTSLPRSPNVHPIKTKAWMKQGPKDVNAVVDKVIVYAEVKQGNNAVLNADVRAQVSPPKEEDFPQIYKLLDNGQGADRQANDGIYSRYVTTYPSPGRYSVKAQVTDGGKALINTGFLTAPYRSKREIQEEEREMGDEINKKKREEGEERSLEHVLGLPDICCGSQVPVAPNAPQTGPFQRTYSGGSFKITKIPEGDNLAPVRVRDLRVELISIGWARGSLPTHASVAISWTAPGDDMDNGIVSGYELRMATNKDEVQDPYLNANTTNSSSTWSVVDLKQLPLLMAEGGIKINLQLSLTVTWPVTFFALRAWDDEDNMSKFSNTAVLQVDVPSSRGSGGGLQVWVVVVMVVVACVMVLVALLCVARKRRTTANQRLIC